MLRSVVRLLPNLQIASNIHTQLGAYPRLPSAASVLLLAGNIGNPEHVDVGGPQSMFGAPRHGRNLQVFLRDVSLRFDQVVYVPGTSEFHTSGWTTRDQRHAELLRLVAQFPNVHVLDNSSHLVADGRIEVVGSCLWAPGFDTQYRICTGPHTTLDAHTVGGWHTAAREYLASTIHSPYPPGVTARVIMTHFAPPPFLRDLMPMVDLWVSGRARSAFDIDCAGLRWVCNPTSQPKVVNLRV